MEDRVKQLKEVTKRGNTVYICGNGGSACNSEHFAEDLLSKGIRAIALTHIGNVTATGNDFGYDLIFSRQLEVLGKKGDLLITLSCSGTSLNVLKAHDVAKRKKMDIWIFPTNMWTQLPTPLTENVHAMIIHHIYQSL